MYELLFIVPAPLTEKDLPDVLKKIKGAIEELGGEFVKEENLGNKKLAYPIKRVFRGFYLLVIFKISAEKIKILDQKLKLTPEVLRFLITKSIERKLVPTRKKPSSYQKITEKEFLPEKSEELALKEPGEKKEEEEKPKEKTKKSKIDLKKLGEKIDDLFKI